MIEYLTTGVIVLLLYAAVIGVLILIGGEDELLATNDADERDGKALSDSKCTEVSNTRVSIAGLVCCYCDERVAERELRARAKDGNA